MNNNDKYLRSIQDLEKVGAKWWPKEVMDEAMRISILQYLIASQEKFISILTLADKHQPSKLFGILDASEFPYQLFLKHLILLTDVGSEPLQRFNSAFAEIFPLGKLLYSIGDRSYEYEFEALPIKGKPTNKKLQIDTIQNLKKTCHNIKLCRDLIMLLIYGAASGKSVLYRCNAFEYIGDEDCIKTFVRQNYLRVSRIVGGKLATDLGNVAQSYAVQYLKDHLGGNYNVESNGKIPGVQLEEGKDATFDIVVDRKDDDGKYKAYVGIEVSFQETSNSTVERKGREARARFQSTNNRRCYVAYIIDGAGNFSRPAAASDMCNNSHCNVGYTPEEFKLLTEFIKEKIG